jgi:hypothetical protein
LSVKCTQTVACYSYVLVDRILPLAIIEYDVGHRTEDAAAVL